MVRAGKRFLKISMPPLFPSLNVLIARNNRVAAVLYYGPRWTVLLSLWNLETDEFEDGQWLKGAIYGEVSDLSPDGDLIIYSASKRSGPIQYWTAISTPPWLTAHVLWRDGGGGLFAKSECIVLGRQRGPLKPEQGQLPADWPKTILLNKYGHYRGKYSVPELRQRRDGWIYSGEPKLPLACSLPDTADIGTFRYKSIGDGSNLWVLEGERLTGGGAENVRFGVLSLTTGDTCLGEIDWADLDHNGDVLYARSGALFRLRVGADCEAVMVRDFTHLKFEKRRAPYDTRKPCSPASDRIWDPLDEL